MSERERPPINDHSLPRGPSRCLGSHGFLHHHSPRPSTSILNHSVTSYEEPSREWGPEQSHRTTQTTMQPVQKPPLERRELSFKVQKVHEVAIWAPSFILPCMAWDCCQAKQGSKGMGDIVSIQTTDLEIDQRN